MDILIDKSNNLSVKGCRYTHKAIRSRPKTIPFTLNLWGKSRSYVKVEKFSLNHLVSLVKFLYLHK